jgi:oligopeptide/dipeptide ABC transporter ATP-binding protein
MEAAPAEAPAPFLDVRDLSVEFRVSARDWRGAARRLRAVDGVSLGVQRRETLALVGESGCGKTTLGRTILRMHEPIAGSVALDGVDVTAARGADLLAYRRRAQMVFQDPYASLNPRMKVEDIIAEPLRAHRIGNRASRRARVRELLDLVNLPASAAGRFPHAFSGGQRQRIGIARALAPNPDLLIADEPVSALDVSIQAQIVNLLRRLQAELGVTLLVIAHDLAVVRQMAPRICVMYLGRIVEAGPRDALFERPAHPYTQALLSAVAVPNPRIERTRERIILRGDVPSAFEPPAGCAFHTRCPHAMDVCGAVSPRLRVHDGREVACHLHHPPDSAA